MGTGTLRILRPYERCRDITTVGTCESTVNNFRSGHLSVYSTDTGQDSSRTEVDRPVSQDLIVTETDGDGVQTVTSQVQVRCIRNVAKI